MYYFYKSVFFCCFSAHLFEHHCQTTELITMVLCCKIIFMMAMFASDFSLEIFIISVAGGVFFYC